ncbi:hypothetical protein AB0P40_40890, partial [Streptomyces sp. NPDC079189]|uniref:hypothetical protein n=1 Tax=Streptomyces sp. NPDC079189 TaxID=3154514 RepID=UPI003418396F
ADLSTDVRVWKVNKVKSKKAPYQRRTLSGRIGPALLLRQRLVALIPAVRFRSRGVTRQHG